MGVCAKTVGSFFSVAVALMTELMSFATAKEITEAINCGDTDAPELMPLASWMVLRRGAKTTAAEEALVWCSVMAWTHGPEWPVELLAQTLEAEAAASGILRAGAVQLDGSRLGAGADAGSAAVTAPEWQQAVAVMRCLVVAMAVL